MLDLHTAMARVQSRKLWTVTVGLYISGRAARSKTVHFITHNLLICLVNRTRVVATWHSCVLFEFTSVSSGQVKVTSRTTVVTQSLNWNITAFLTYTVYGDLNCFHSREWLSRFTPAITCLLCIYKGPSETNWNQLIYHWLIDEWLRQNSRFNTDKPVQHRTVAKIINNLNLQMQKLLCSLINLPQLNAGMMYVNRNSHEIKWYRIHLPKQRRLHCAHMLKLRGTGAWHNFIGTMPH